MPDLRLHHVGCAVASIPDAVEAYRPIARNVGAVIPIAAQGVAVCFVEIAPGAHVELVQPTEGTSPVGQLLKKRISYYHLGFLTADFDRTVEELTAAGHQILASFRSEAFGMRRCAFLASPVAHLIEVIEEPAG
jgi:methylmalonyl-CoA/ethylmalonyl-CoA epimerase